MDKVSLKIKDRIFDVEKDTLCEHSDYFRAMFSGNYVENDQKEIRIDTLEPDTMEIILKYMRIGLIDLSDYTMTEVGEIAFAANFLQITELIKQIEYVLEIQLSVSNWIETMTIAEQSSYTKIEKLAITYGLLSFKSMKPEYIPTIQTLSWYLSHPYLYSGNELNVFNFGYQWILHHETGADALLILLGCLDIARIIIPEINDIEYVMREYENSLAAKVVDCLKFLICNHHNITTDHLQKLKTTLCENFTERVFTEVFNLVTNSPKRELEFTPVIPMWLLKETKLELLPHYLYSYTKENKFEQWLEVGEKHLWGWGMASWGPSKLVVVCGERGRGSGLFMQDVRIYDTLKKEWTRHGVQLPPRRHTGLTIMGDTLYIVGGVGAYRVVLDNAMTYDLKERSFRNIAKFPEAIQSPAVCLHNNKVYTAGQKNIYQYVDNGETDYWKSIVRTDMRMSCLRSFRKYIYCTQSYFSHLYRFNPGVDESMELITTFSGPPATICTLLDYLVVFTRTVCRQSDIVSVESYKGEKNERPIIVYTETGASIRVNDASGSCSVITETPPTEWEVSQYLKQYLQYYNE